ncbi:MAG: DUF6261 family protein [Prevotellaceae bacterium]|jgi:hypothetical protein|nr:DUF6261 family protein [Prevotellaceae bacterium]
MSEIKFVTLNLQRLDLGSLTGICTETIDVATPIVITLAQPLLQVKLERMTGNVTILNSLMNRSRNNPLTIQLKEIDGEIGVLYSELKRTIKTAEKSSNQMKSAAANLLLQTFKPFWAVTSQALTSQSAQLEELFSRVNASPEMRNALVVLDLIIVWEELISKNIAFNQIYDRRLEEDAAATAPSASSMKTTVVKDYEEFSKAVELTLSAFPSPKLELLFNAMNELRKKYTHKRPLKFDAEHLFVEPVAAQKYTGAAITPLTKAFYRTGEDSVELLFATDYTLTYKNNIRVGQATVILHGKGRYSGTYMVTFYIEL